MEWKGIGISERQTEKYIKDTEKVGFKMLLCDVKNGKRNMHRACNKPKHWEEESYSPT